MDRAARAKESAVEVRRLELNRMAEDMIRRELELATPGKILEGPRHTQQERRLKLELKDIGKCYIF